MRVREARKAPRHKAPRLEAPPTHDTHTFPAPIRGWVSNESLALAQPGAARVLENIFPTRTGARLRGGSPRHATVGVTPVESILTYRSASVSKMFAATNGNIYDITTPASTIIPPSASITGQTADEYSQELFSTTAAEYLLIVNGADSMLTFDGSAFETVDEATTKLPYDTETGAFTVGLVVTGGTSSATGTIVVDVQDGGTGTLRLKSVSGTFVDNETITDTSTGSAKANIPSGVESIPAITGVATNKFRHVWSYRNRLFFVEDGKKSAYLPVDSIGGAASTFSLEGVFKRGGKLFFGATWSLDAGDGLDDKCAFFSDTGEVAVYEGSNPASASDWNLVGIYDITSPMGQNATMRAGGDVLVATVSGLVPLSEAVRKDVAALSLAAVSVPIEPDWKVSARTRTSAPWSLIKWPEKNMAIVGIPESTTTTAVESDWGEAVWGSFIWGGGTAYLLTDTPYCYVVNLETGAWTVYTGWDVRCLGYHDGNVYFGTSDGRIMLAESGGSDDGSPYTCRYAGLFETLSPVGAEITVLMAQPRWTYGVEFNHNVSVSVDYVVEWPTAPNAAITSTTSEWDTAIWDTSVWDQSATEKVRAEWSSVGLSGSAIAPTVQVVCGQSATPDAELVKTRITYEMGAVVS